METFAYIMAGIIIVTAGLMVLFLKLRDKWANIVRYDALCKNEQYNLLAGICATALIIEVIMMFVVAVINMIHKLV